MDLMRVEWACARFEAERGWAATECVLFKLSESSAINSAKVVSGMWKNKKNRKNDRKASNYMYI